MVPSSDQANRSAQLWPTIAICFVLTVITIAVFGQSIRFDFVNYDDKMYIYENPVVQQGLTPHGLAWAFTYGNIGHWHPLTWISHMADCQFYGLWAGGHHITNVAIQAATAMLLFLALREMTGTLWRCAFVAAVFAIHPLRAESVVWIAERKDVLSGMFFMLTLWAYARYAKSGAGLPYVLAVLLCALGLLCKNMLVTLPFVLLLLDYWPLRRAAPMQKLVVEKLPFFLLAVGSCVATFLVPEKVLDVNRASFPLRAANAVVSCGIYLGKLVYPSKLAIPYLYPQGGFPVWQIVLAVAVLVAISALVMVWRKERPYLLVGWLWYLGMLVPVIGIVQIAYYARADRYTYLPEIGLVIALTWTIADWAANWRHRRGVFGSLMGGVVGVLMLCAWKQASVWKSSESLWKHTLACDPNNYVAEYDLGLAVEHKGRLGEAIEHYRKALAINPNSTEARNNLGTALAYTGALDEAILEYRKVIAIKPDFAEAHYDLGNALLGKRDLADAAAEYERALQIEPDYARAHNNLGNVLRDLGRPAEAAQQFQLALKIFPGFSAAHLNLGIVYLTMGRMDDAISQFQETLKIDPGSVDACNNLGTALQRQGKLDDAGARYRRAIQIRPGYADSHYNLANVLMQQGKTAAAIGEFERTLDLAPRNVACQNNLAWLLATCPDGALRNGKRALAIARQANNLTHDENLLVLHTLAAAYAETGNYPQAIETAGRAMQVAEKKSSAEFVKQLRLEMDLYRSGRPYHAPGTIQ